SSLSRLTATTQLYTLSLHDALPISTDHGPSLMWLKAIIVLLLAAILLSLFSGAFFLRNASSGGRLFTALSVRISLTVLLVLLVAWGLWSGQLQWGAPWLH